MREYSETEITRLEQDDEIVGIHDIIVPEVGKSTVGVQQYNINDFSYALASADVNPKRFSPFGSKREMWLK